jgi:hypothetical protein
MLLALYSFPLTARGEDTFPVLQVGTRTYTNVTVTSKNTNYIFILHDAGMVNIRVADLSPEVQDELGVHPPAPKLPASENAKIIAKQAIAKVQSQVQSPVVKAAEAKVVGAWQENIANRLPPPSAFTPQVLGLLCGGLLLVHLFLSFCSKSICTKANSQPGFLIWIPVFQIIPLLRAAGMSAWWFLLCIIPVFNILPGVIWSVKIVHARSLNALVIVMLLIPGLNIIAFFVLAFAPAPPIKVERKVPTIMSLEEVM